MCIFMCSHCVFFYSLTEVPSVEPSTMCADLKNLQEEADCYDLIHDAVLQVRLLDFIIFSL